MSAPLNVSAYQLKQIANALEDLSKVRNTHGVEIGGHGGPPSIRLVDADVELEVKWDDDKDEYWIDDRIGS